MSLEDLRIDLFHYFYKYNFTYLSILRRKNLLVLLPNREWWFKKILMKEICMPSERTSLTLIGFRSTAMRNRSLGRASSKARYHQGWQTFILIFAELSNNIASNYLNYSVNSLSCCCTYARYVKWECNSVVCLQREREKKMRKFISKLVWTL